MHTKIYYLTVYVEIFLVNETTTTHWVCNWGNSYPQTQKQIYERLISLSRVYILEFGELQSQNN